VILEQQPPNRAAGPAHFSLIVFADDWGRHPSSCQHLVSRLLCGREVVWVNTIATRTPRLDIATFRRGLQKLADWTSRKPQPDEPSAGPRVVNPWMWPWMSGPASRGLNRRLLGRQLDRALTSVARPRIAVTTLPIVADLMGRLPVDRWVYYCVDDFSQWPGLDQKAMAALEREVVRRADLVVAAGENLASRITSLGRQPRLLPHGVDLSHWKTTGETAEPPALSGLERPLVVFWGLVDRRMDTAFMRRLSADLDRGTIVLVGPQAEPDPELLSLPRVRLVPALPYAELPAVAREAAVLVMPYADLPVTRAMQPLKLKEYLATGRPVVARNLPAVSEWSDCLDAVSAPHDFSSAVCRRIRDGLSQNQQAARSRLVDETWDARSREFADLMSCCLAEDRA
jgi:glycosyltransferase involved in cell wall biosynthesis